MSDLSDPPPTAVVRTPAVGPRTKAWPAPPEEGYPPGTGLDDQEPCELVGPTGGTTRVRLVDFNLQAQSISLQTPQGRNAVGVRFEQFQRLDLL